MIFCRKNTVLYLPGKLKGVWIAEKMIGRTGEFNVGALTEDVPYETIRYFGFQTCHEVNKFEGCEGFKRSCNKLLRLTGHTNAPQF